MQDDIGPKAPRAREQRREVDLQAFALRAAGSCIDITLLDLSYDGCLFRSEEMFEIAERLRLIIRRRGVIDAQLRWFGSGKAGVRFAQG